MKAKTEQAQGEQVELPVEFHKALENLINKHGRERGSDTPDFILAEYLNGCLELFNETVKKREKWYSK